MKLVFMRIGCVVAVLSCVVLFGSTARADWVEIQKDYNLYGHVYNTDDGTSTGTGISCCCPTATINSFRYLEQKYPGLYDTKLTKGNIVVARDTLANGWDARPGMGCPSTYKDIWENKVWYIEDNAPDTTVFSGMVNANIAGWYRAEDLVGGAYPTWDYLWEELGKCEDIEIGIQPLETGDGHCLTLTSLKFNDENDNGVWDTTEARKIDYLDPNNPSQLFEADLLVGVGGRFEFTWHNGGANPQQLVYIDLAYAESPIPEPGMFLMLGAGILALLFRKRKA